jgi:hypothetical protein
MSALIQEVKNLEKYRKIEMALKLKDELSVVFETYVLEKLPIYINWMKSKIYTKDKILE